jgi:hypothetical protein
MVNNRDVHEALPALDHTLMEINVPLLCQFRKSRVADKRLIGLCLLHYMKLLNFWSKKLISRAMLSAYSGCNLLLRSLAKGLPFAICLP